MLAIVWFWLQVRRFVFWSRLYIHISLCPSSALNHLSSSFVASPRLQPVEEVCACRAEGQAAHPQTLWTRPHGGSQEGCADQTSGSIIISLVHEATLLNILCGFFSWRSGCSFICAYVHVCIKGTDPPACHWGAYEPVSGTSLQGAGCGRRHPGPSWWVGHFDA